MPHLVKMILDGEKTCTWRVFDEKDLVKGNEIKLMNKESGEVFGTAKVTDLYTKTFGTLNDEDFVGHEGFLSETEMYETYQSYYPDKMVDSDTELKILRFDFIKLPN